METNQTIKYLKTDKTMTGKELAHLVGVDPTTISSYVRYRTKPSMDTMIAILKVTKIERSEVLTKGGKQLEIEKIEREKLNNMVEFKSKTEKEHYQIIKKFKDSETAKDFTDVLARLESLSPAKFYGFFGKIKGLVIEEELRQDKGKTDGVADNGTEGEL